MAGVGEKWRQLYLNNSKKKERKKVFIYFLERREGRERERNINT